MESGRIEAAIAELIRGEKTGVLEVEDGIGINRAYFASGQPQGAKLAKLSNPLGQIMLDLELVTQEALNQALATHNRTDQLVGQVLVDMEVLDNTQVNTAMSEQSRRNFFTLFELPFHKMAFLEGMVHLQGFVPYRMSGPIALHRALCNHVAPKALNKHLGLLGFHAHRLSDDTLLEHAWEPAIMSALEQLRTHVTPSELAERLPVSPHRVAGLLVCLSLLDALETVHPLRKGLSSAS